MSSLHFFAALGIILAGLTAWADPRAVYKPLSTGMGADSSGGGSIIRDELGQLVLADEYFQSRNYELPSGYSKRIQLSERPEYALMLGELDRIRSFVSIRNDGKDPFRFQLEDFEIYLTEKLSGDDAAAAVENDLNSQQVVFTYKFIQYSEDYSQETMRRIIEIKPSLFNSLVPRKQALLMLHEIAHHLSRGGHEIISPTIQCLSVLLAIEERQLGGDLSPISEKEFQSSIKFQNLLRVLTCGNGAKTCSPVTWIDRAGGGLVQLVGDACERSGVSCGGKSKEESLVRKWPEEFPVKGRWDGNFVGVSSVLRVLALDGQSEFIGNVFIQFNEARGVRLGRKCNNNVFKNISTQPLYPIVDGPQKNLPKYKYGVEIVCAGSRNDFENVQTGAGFRILGDDNKVQDSVISGWNGNYSSTNFLMMEPEGGWVREIDSMNWRPEKLEYVHPVIGNKNVILHSDINTMRIKDSNRFERAMIRVSFGDPYDRGDYGFSSTTILNSEVTVIKSGEFDKVVIESAKVSESGKKNPSPLEGRTEKCNRSFGIFKGNCTYTFDFSKMLFTFPSGTRIVNQGK